MPITDADIRFRASERMTDFADGGGLMSTVDVIDNVDNNVFPDVTDLDRLTGRVSLRKVYAAVLNADSDTFLSAHVVLDKPADDEAISAVVFATGGIATERAQVLAELEASSFWDLANLILNAVYSTGYTYYEQAEAAATWSTGGSTITLPASLGNLDLSNPTYTTVRVPEVGAVVALTVGGVSYMAQVTARSVMTHTSAGSYSGTNSVTVDITLPAFAAGGVLVQLLPNGAASVRVYGVGNSDAGAASGATSIEVNSCWARLVPLADGVTPASIPAWDIGTLLLAQTQGRAPWVRAGDPLLVHHTAEMAPATVSNSQTVDTGRTALARLRVIGNNGVEHARFTANQPAPSGVGCTADLTAGTVTFTDVSGMSQPVTVEHRIEEMVLATTVTLTTIGLNRALSRAYPAGTRVSSLLVVGDLQGRATGGFAQQAWTGAWSDAVLGGVPLGDYNDPAHPIQCTNAGSVTERWAVIFTGATAFRVVGESLGEITTGNTGSDCEPINPATGAPYFSIPQEGWGSGWAAGNVYRFNTLGGNAPVWALRCVAPSLPGGDEHVTLQMRGYVNT